MNLLSFKYQVVTFDDVQCVDISYLVCNLVVTYATILGEEIALPVDYDRLQAVNPSLYQRIRAHKDDHVRKTYSGESGNVQPQAAEGVAPGSADAPGVPGPAR